MATCSPRDGTGEVERQRVPVRRGRADTASPAGDSLGEARCLDLRRSLPLRRLSADLRLGVLDRWRCLLALLRLLVRGDGLGEELTDNLHMTGSPLAQSRKPLA